MAIHDHNTLVPAAVTIQYTCVADQMAIHSTHTHTHISTMVIMMMVMIMHDGDDDGGDDDEERRKKNHRTRNFVTFESVNMFFEYQ